MDERKPTYEELLKRNKQCEQNSKSNLVIISFFVLVGMGFIITMIVMLAGIGLDHVIEYYNTQEPLSSLLFATLRLGYWTLVVYIFWHFFLATYVTMPEEYERLADKIRCMIKGAKKAAHEYDNKDTP